MSDSPRFLTVVEIAREMRVSEMTVYRLLRNGEIPATRVGRGYRVTRQAVEEYLAQPAAVSA